MDDITDLISRIVKLEVLTNTLKEDVEQLYELLHHHVQENDDESDQFKTLVWSIKTDLAVVTSKLSDHIDSNKELMFKLEKLSDKQASNGKLITKIMAWCAGFTFAIGIVWEVIRLLAGK